MNDNLRELKTRARKLDELLLQGGLANMDFAQAVSRLHRAMRRSDRSREPGVQLVGLVEDAEKLALSLT
jgi:hypothetical protein